MKISIIGLGFVGSAMYNSFINKGFVENYNIYIYDKYKNGGVGKIENILLSDICFLALPTPYNEDKKCYELDSIHDCCKYLTTQKYTGTIIIKSTVEPTTTEKLNELYPELNLIHNPEFLTARTAYEDFHNQKHIVLGKGPNCVQDKFELVIEFYKTYYSDAKISQCTSLESESMKIFCNSFYALKVQFFTEIYLLCQKNNCDYNVVRQMMLNNNWINPMHTLIPGPDGKISYGGLCFPKDTNALNEYMERLEVPHLVLESCIKERDLMRNDNDNITKNIIKEKDLPNKNIIKEKDLENKD